MNTDKKKKKKFLYSFIVLLVVLLRLFIGNFNQPDSDLPVSSAALESSVSPSQQETDESLEVSQISEISEHSSVSLDSLPEYSGQPYVILNDNQPEFTEEDYSTASFEWYGDLDSLGRCTLTYANVGTDLMPTEKRGSISHVKPTGWHTTSYDNVDGKSLYNRCHLIGWQLTGENANKKNLITGTRYLNVEGMLPFENMIADYVKETNNHVLYRVTPIFSQDNLVADGVEMEAWSVEDEGEGICFHIFAYNVQPGIEIDYATGESWLAEETLKEETDNVTAKEDEIEIRGNSSSKIYHCPGQEGYEKMEGSSKLVIFHSEEEAIAAGYRKAKR